MGICWRIDLQRCLSTRSTWISSIMLWRKTIAMLRRHWFISTFISYDHHCLPILPFLCRYFLSFDVSTWRFTDWLTKFTHLISYRSSGIGHNNSSLCSVSIAQSAAYPKSVSKRKRRCLRRWMQKDVNIVPIANDIDASIQP